MTSQQAYDLILCEVSSKYGAPKRRLDVGEKPTNKRIFDRKVYLTGGHDKGGAYWGNGGGQLRVEYTSDLTYVKFYRV